jgi:hypothetical protein
LDEKPLHEWATPLAGINARPKHISAKGIIPAPGWNLRTYPVLLPWPRARRRLGDAPEDRAATAYRTGETQKTEADWIEAGMRVFEEIDFLHLRTLDPKHIQEIRSKEAMGNPACAPFRTAPWP